MMMMMRMNISFLLSLLLWFELLGWSEPFSLDASSNVNTAATATALDVGRSNAALVFLAAFMGAVNGWVASETVIGGGLLR